MRSTQQSTRRTTVAAVVAAAAVVGGTAVTAQADGTERISFEPGATSTVVEGSLAAGEQDSYVLGARAGQQAVVHLEGTGGAVSWTLVGPEGSPLHTGMAQEQEDVSVALPTTGDYDLDVRGTGEVGYELDLTIPAPLVLGRGGTTTTVSGAVSPTQGTEDAYSFRARAGQEATVDLSSGAGPATWSLVAPDGSPLHAGMTQEQGHVVTTLPADGVYDLVVSTDAGSTDYDLTLTIPAG